MANQNPSRTLGLLAAAVLLIVLFVAYRARTFTYCVGFDDRSNGRAVPNAQSCGAGEREMERVDWQRRGLRSKIKLAGSTVARAFGVDWP